MSTSSAHDLSRDVLGALAQSAAWRALPPERKQKFSDDLLTVTKYFEGGARKEPRPLAQAQAEQKNDPVTDTQARLAGKQGLVGQEFKAGAMQQGVEEFGNLVKTVDFPAFVSGLIQGVFQAIVDASIQQMQAYGELIAATAASVEQFAGDNISDSNAREHIAQRHRSLVRIENGKLVPREGADDFSALGEDVDFSDEESETKLINAAKLEMARQRQKMMALMVMMGINRIVVTNGRINAKVVFDIEANDQAQRAARAGMVDTKEDESGMAGGFHMPWGGGGGYSKNKHKTTVRSSVDETSESKAQMKAQLTGEVRVNFKSETLPPEKMMDALQFDQINYLSQANAPRPAPAPGAAAPAPAAGAAPAAPPPPATTPAPGGAR